jgi:hypothetical protein
MLPADNAYNWAAFNKLLLLGLLAPVEEATAAAVPAGAHRVLQQQRAAYMARKVGSKTWCVGAAVLQLQWVHAIACCCRLVHAHCAACASRLLTCPVPRAPGVSRVRAFAGGGGGSVQQHAGLAQQLPCSSGAGAGGC